MKREAIVILVFSGVAALGAWSLPSQKATSEETRAQAPPPVCEWVPGDLHVPATDLSQPGFALGTQPLSVGELAGIASQRGLDYVVLVGPRGSELDADPAFDASGLDWLIGTEERFPTGTVVASTPPSQVTPANSGQTIDDFARDVHSAGGFLQLSGVESSTWTPRLLSAVDPDSVEVWRGGPFSYPTPGIQKNSLFALRFYDRLLDGGVKAAVAGGSATAGRALLELAGPGQPTTWVCIEKSGASAVARAIGRGRLTISHESPAADAPLLTLEADEDGDGSFEIQMGDSVDRGSTVRVSARGAPAARVRLIGSRSRLLREFTTDSFE
jgi:hypothetical protein